MLRALSDPFFAIFIGLGVVCLVFMAKNSWVSLSSGNLNVIVFISIVIYILLRMYVNSRS